MWTISNVPIVIRISAEIRGHAFVPVTEDFDVTSTKASPLISSFVYI